MSRTDTGIRRICGSPGLPLKRCARYVDAKPGGARMEWIFAIAVIVLPILVIRDLYRRHLVSRTRSAARELGLVVIDHFMGQPCGRCHEFQMRLISVSPNARSIHYECVSCEKKTRSPAATPDASSAARLDERFQRLTAKHNARFPRRQIEIDVLFCTPEAPLPFEQTRREPISEAARSEVWRRDGGRCVQCGSNQNLEFDHIIPVSRGGATTARNLQLLCKTCNRQKSAKI